MCSGDLYDQNRIVNRQKEIKTVAKNYGFERTIQLDICSSDVDKLSKKELIDKFKYAFDEIKPNIIFTPFLHDAHSDHYFISDAVLSCSKWFRFNYVKKVYFYETISETDHNLNPLSNNFYPNSYYDITNYIDHKIDIMKNYSTELGEHPFPRSISNLIALSQLRGSQSGYIHAEAFVLVVDRID
jgi:LmbE family N-acetylglucosaminyl deacetylase